MTIPDVFTTLTNAIWAEAGRGRSVASIRRDLQRMYLGELMQLHVSPNPGTPDDARAIARVTLVELNGRLARALTAGGLDAYTGRTTPIRGRRSSRRSGRRRWSQHRCCASDGCLDIPREVFVLTCHDALRPGLPL